MQMPPYGFIVLASLQNSAAFHYSHKVLLIVIFATGAWMLYSAFHKKRFHYRGGGVMPLWWGRLSSFLGGIFLMWAVVHFWNR
jgi:ABC-type enterobactin transport system permease subunit